MKKKKKKTRGKRPRKLTKPNRLPLIAKALRKRTKAELIAMILAIAKDHAGVARELEDQLKIDKPIGLLVADVAAAISRATDFDERMTNHNFDVDWQAYADVEKGLTLLVRQGQLEAAKELTLDLMKDGSYQVECSDEGLMTDDICRCLKPVIQAVKKAGGIAAIEWATAMLNADREGYISCDELEALKGDS